jgi:hypothetical protein
MHIMIKNNYLDLSDVLSVSDIETIGNEGCRLFTIVYKSGVKCEFFYASYYTSDVEIKNDSFCFGTYAFFDNAHKDIINKLTNAS